MLPGRCVEDCVLVMKALWSDRMFCVDPFIPPLPFRDDVYTSDKPLRIGYFTTDGFFEPSSACKRAVTDAVAALSRNPNVTLIPFQPPCMTEAVMLFYSLMTADAGATLLNTLEVCYGV